MDKLPDLYKELYSILRIAVQEVEYSQIFK